ncbi:hypothetical protein ACFX2H_027046 [Malus domestica]
MVTVSFFRYEGNSKFHACIFDRSATGIEYPLPLPGMEETDEDDDESVEILEDFPPCPRTRKKSPLPSPLPHKIKRISTSIDSTSKKLETKSTLWMKPLAENEKAIALQRAIDFKSENPHFKVAMQPSYIFNQLILPSEFAKRYLTQHPTGSVILRVPDGRTWNVKFKYENKRARFLLDWLAFVEDNNLKIGDYLRSEFTQRHLNVKSAGGNAILKGPNGGTWSVKLKCENSKARFLQGWQAFVTDNNLEVDDVCVFTLMKDVKLSFEVFVFRTTEAANCRMSPTGPSDTSFSAVEAAKKFVSSNPFFRVTHGLGSSRVLRIPTSFSKHFIEKKKQIVTLRVDDRMWHVSLTVH